VVAWVDHHKGWAAAVEVGHHPDVEAAVAVDLVQDRIVHPIVEEDSQGVVGDILEDLVGQGAAFASCEFHSKNNLAAVVDHLVHWCLRRHFLQLT